LVGLPFSLEDGWMDTVIPINHDKLLPDYRERGSVGKYKRPNQLKSAFLR
jgi:hypothetical protein